MLTLTLKERPHVPLEAECLSPDVVAGLANDAVRALPAEPGSRRSRMRTVHPASRSAAAPGR